MGAAEAIDWHQRLADTQVIGGKAWIQWKELIAFKRSYTEAIPRAREAQFRKAGVDIYRTRGRFLDPHTVQADDNVLQACKIVIATGARPAPLPIEGLNLLKTSTDFLELEHLPPRIIFIGGGFISFEFAHVAARAGAREITIVEAMPRPLAPFEAPLVDELVRATERLGIHVRTGTPATRIYLENGIYRVDIQTPTGPQALEAELAVHSAGRIPDIDDLHLEAAQVTRNRDGVAVNAYLQSISNPDVYAGGDAAGTGAPKLTPVAGRDGAIIAHNLLHGNTLQADYRAIPSTVFTLPPLSTVGLREDQARERGYAIEVHQRDMSSWYAHRRINEQYARSKVILDRTKGTILGAHILGHNSEEIINLFALVVRQELPASVLKEMFYAYPTHASNIPYMF